VARLQTVARTRRGGADVGAPPYRLRGNRARYVRSALATLLLSCVLVICVAAGVWQLGRAGQKHDLRAAFAAGQLVDEIHVAVSDDQADAHRFRRFQLFGTYDAAHQVLLDNMTAQGAAGYQILTPLRTDGRTVLVNRGWVPANPDRSILPDIRIDGGPREVSGRLSPLSRPGIRVDARDPADTHAAWPRRLHYPTVDDLAEQLGYAVADYQILLNADEPDGFRREWKPVEIGPERHYGYAFQWFCLATLSLVIFVLLQRRWLRQHKNADGRFSDGKFPDGKSTDG